ncbi:MAG: ABC transporter ATP-binding protein, partial [Candidatus Marinimicrobia bacterium]|nr:ABC transporter ATP-binding protein [Candidatus Neomarinimicrobiota bacterium]
EYSGGMRQRALIAMALAQEPDLLIADEPTTALDVTIQAQIIDLLKELNDKKGLSILFISHDLSLVRSFAHRTMVMYAGRIVESAPTDIIFSEPKHPYTKALMQVASLAKEKNEFITINGSVPDPRYYPSGCPFHPRCDVAEEECSLQFPELVQKENHSWNCIHKK